MRDIYYILPRSIRCVLLLHRVLLAGLGEAEVADLLPWLISTLKEEGNSTVERSGAAQGLAEVLVALGMDRLADCVVDLLPLSGHAKPGPREGLLWLLVFLPSSLGKECALLIPRTLPIILQLLSDDMEVVRDVALRAGQVYVKMFSRTDAQLLAGPLEAGLFSLSWRIRQASVKLVGQMLAEIAGTPAPVIVAGNVEDAFEEDEDEDGEERGRYDEDSASESDDEEDKGAEGADGPSSPPFADPKARLEAAAAAAAAVARGGAKPSGGSPSPTGGASSPPPPSEEGADATGKGKRGGDFYGKKKGPEKPVAQGRKKLTEEEKDARDRSNKREDRSAAPPPGRGGGGGGGGGKRPSNNPAATRKPVMDEHYVAPSQLDAASQAVVRVLGNEGRARILASMYAVRCDVSVVVRQSALKVRKTICVVFCVVFGDVEACVRPFVIILFFECRGTLKCLFIARASTLTHTHTRTHTRCLMSPTLVPHRTRRCGRTPCRTRPRRCGRCCPPSCASSSRPSRWTMRSGVSSRAARWERSCASWATVCCRR